MMPCAIAPAFANHANLRHLARRLENHGLAVQASRVPDAAIARASAATCSESPPPCSACSRSGGGGTQRARVFRKLVYNSAPAAFANGRETGCRPATTLTHSCAVTTTPRTTTLLNRGTYREERSWKSQQNLAPAHPWLPRPHGHQERPRRAQPPPRQRSPAHDGLDEVIASPPVAARLQPTVTGKLQRADRLRHKSEFDAVFQRGRRAHGPHLSVIATPVREPAAPPRLGLAVAKGVGHAPARARLRRLAREAFRALRPSLQRPFDVVVSSRQPWPDAQLADVLAELSWLGRKLRLLP